MSRSRRRQSKRRSAAERSPIKRASASGRQLQQSASANDSSVTSTATPLELDGSMADRYYAMAENMNTRGAMEMAVPFYRQAITLLLAERASLQQKLGGASAQPVAQELPMDELHGLARPQGRWAVSLHASSHGHGCACAVGTSRRNGTGFVHYKGVHRGSDR